MLEIAFEQLDPAEIHQRKTGSACVVDEPGELERLVQPAAGGGGVPVPQGEFREVREPEGRELEVTDPAGQAICVVRQLGCFLNLAEHSHQVAVVSRHESEKPAIPGGEGARDRLLAQAYLVLAQAAPGARDLGLRRSVRGGA